jgi:catechol 2,3-dioxygenase-like lactoylglutathione lyase family enzyme
MRLELVPVPVSDVDRAKAFYQKAGFGSVHDTQVTDTMRVVQFTQPGSVKGLHLVVKGIDEAREALVGRGVDVGEVDDMGGVKYAWFSDPDGSLWGLQQRPAGYEG